MCVFNSKASEAFYATPRQGEKRENVILMLRSHHSGSYTAKYTMQTTLRNIKGRNSFMHPQRYEYSVEVTESRMKVKTGPINNEGLF